MAKKSFKKTIKYILTYTITVTTLFLLLIGTAKIPREKIVEKIKETQECLNIPNAHADKYIIAGKQYTTTHAYADIMLLNIIYYIDTNNVIPSVMEAKYYSTNKDKHLEIDFSKIIEEGRQANVQYMRYWHGSMSIIRPLLMFFNLSQIYIINAIILTILAVTLLIMLIKTGIKELVIAYIIGLIMCTIIVVPFCLEYFWTFLIMFIVSIIGIILNKKEKNMNTLFLITGILTCYFDFLTTEIITFLIPIIIILTIRYKQNKTTNFKEGFKFFVISTLFWSLGYIGMWISKWVLASLILKVNAYDYVINDMKYRINGTGHEQTRTLLKHIPNLPLKAIKININTLFAFDILKKYDLNKVLPVCLIIAEIVFIRKKEIKKLWFSGLLLIIAIIPYIRYAVLSSHSFTHNYFTFRSQIVTIMAIILAIVYSVDKNILKKQIKMQ
ncbi:MAG: hypothetical protein HFJ36_06165 [Clostridia bacterium]|nr:hypothetical protein [Clostridia bacterium]